MQHVRRVGGRSSHPGKTLPGHGHGARLLVSCALSGRHMHLFASTLRDGIDEGACWNIMRELS